MGDVLKAYFVPNGSYLMEMDEDGDTTSAAPDERGAPPPEEAGLSAIVRNEETIGHEHIETRLDDPEGDAADLQPIRSVEHNSARPRSRRKSTRKRGERSTNPHGVRREKLSDEEDAAD